MGDNSTSSGQVSSQLFTELEKYLPGLVNNISGTLGTTNQGQLGAEQGVASGYQNLYNQNQLASAQTEANVANGPGQQLVNAADTYQKQLDPQYYQQRTNLNNALTSYLNYDPNKLSPTEVAQISRGINATTGPVTPSNLNTIQNAQTFGDAGTKRWQNFGDAITKAASAIPTLKSGINGFATATTRGQDTGARQATNNSLGANFGFSSTALGDLSGTQNAARSQVMSDWQKALMGAQALNQVTSAAGNVAKMGA